MDEQARQQAFMSALATEHFVLQSARSAGFSPGAAASVGVTTALALFGLHVWWEVWRGDKAVGWRKEAQAAPSGAHGSGT